MRWFFLLALSTLSFLGAHTPRSLSWNSADGIFDVGPTQYVTDDAGDTMAVWQVFNGNHTVLQFAYKQVGHAWQVPGDPADPRNVISPFFYSIIDWQVVMDRHGNAAIVWRIFNGTKVVVQAIYRPKGDHTRFSHPGDPIDEIHFLNNYLYPVAALPQIGIGNGRVTILWKVFNGYNNVLQVSTKVPGKPFTRPGNPTQQKNIINYLSLQQNRFDITTQPLFFVDNLGDAIVAWQIITDQGITAVQAVTKFDGHHFEIAGNPNNQHNILSPRIYSIRSLESASIGAGNAVVYWKRISQVTGNLILQAAFKRKGGQWQRPEFDQ